MKNFLIGFVILITLGIILIFLNTLGIQKMILNSAITSSQPLITPQEVANQSDNPDRYGVTLTQTGGIGSQIISTKIIEWDMLASAQYCDGYLWESGYCYHYLNPTENYVTTSFWNPGDAGGTFSGEPNWLESVYSIKIGCKSGYKITYAQSSTNSPLDTYFEGIANMSITMEILNQSSNSLYIVCTKSS